VLLGHQDIPLEDVYEELRRRFGTSGIEEKNSRAA
jgi:phosphoribosyl-ATP pyrophosphohydrolase